jgi:hypothetical protein
MRRLIPILLFALSGGLACDDRSYREIGRAIDALTKKGGELPGPAIARLARIGRRAVPQIETALHTAPARGKVNLVLALAAIGEPESTAILQHFAVYDADPEVRTACEQLLAKWATGHDTRTAPAKQALARIEARRRLGQAE